MKKLYRDWTEAHRVGFSFQLQSINSVQPHSPAVSEREKTIIINFNIFGNCFVSFLIRFDFRMKLDAFVQTVESVFSVSNMVAIVMTSAGCEKTQKGERM